MLRMCTFSNCIRCLLILIFAFNYKVVFAQSNTGNATIRAPIIRASIGNAFGVDGNHGGTNIDLRLVSGMGNWEAGLNWGAIGELDLYPKRYPTEDYHKYGISFGRNFTSGLASLSFGIEIESFSGLSRTSYKSSSLQCKHWHMFLGCPDSDEIKVDEYESQSFNTVDFGPYLNADIQLFKYVGIGVAAEGFINKYQGLGAVYFSIYIGNKLH